MHLYKVHPTKNKKKKVWCYQAILYQRVMWPLKMSEIPSSVVNKMDGLANSLIRKWLGLPRCFSEVGLFGRNTLQLPLRSIIVGYKQEKARLVLELRETTDQLVRAAGTQIRTGRKVESPRRGRQGNRQAEAPRGGRQSPGGSGRPWEGRYSLVLVKGFQRRSKSHGGGGSGKS